MLVAAGLQTHVKTRIHSLHEGNTSLLVMLLMNFVPVGRHPFNPFVIKIRRAMGITSDIKTSRGRLYILSVRCALACRKREGVIMD